MEVLSEVRRVEERLRPFIERTHSILGTATLADYNNNVRTPLCFQPVGLRTGPCRSRDRPLSQGRPLLPLGWCGLL